MEIQEYKNEILKLIAALEKEHGCTVRKMESEKEQRATLCWPQWYESNDKLTIEVE